MLPTVILVHLLWPWLATRCARACLLVTATCSGVGWLEPWPTGVGGLMPWRGAGLPRRRTRGGASRASSRSPRTCSRGPPTRRSRSPAAALRRVGQLHPLVGSGMRVGGLWHQRRRRRVRPVPPGPAVYSLAEAARGRLATQPTRHRCPHRTGTRALRSWGGCAVWAGPDTGQGGRVPGGPGAGGAAGGGLLPADRGAEVTLRVLRWAGAAHAGGGAATC